MCYVQGYFEMALLQSYDYITNIIQISLKYG